MTVASQTTTRTTELAVARRARLDVELVRRGLARSREHAADLLGSGRVSVGGQPAAKAATAVDPASAIVVAPQPQGAEYASRGGHKLAGALDHFAAEGLSVAGRCALDAGASTGGFTDVLLRRGATRVVAADVGYGQLAWPLRRDPRVRVFDRTNVRDLTAAMIGGPVEVVVADLSFISLRLVLPAFIRCAAPAAEHLLLVKPQFEVGRGHVGRGGVVRDAGLRATAMRSVAETAEELGLGTRGAVASGRPGPSGNVEYFLWLRADAPAPREELFARAVQEGPQ